jgi:HSP20 family molecular chaperone IbpA
MIVRHRTPFSAGFATGFPAGLDRSLDRAFDQLTSQLLDPRRRVPTVEGRWDDGSLVLVVDLPGVPAEAVSVEVSGRTLTLGAHTDALDWSRQVELGTSLDPDKVTARHLDGRLTVTVGQVDAPATRRVAIDTSPAPTPIEATQSSDTTDTP